MLQNIPNKSTKLIVIGSTSTSLDKDVANRLLEQGALVWRRYLNDIQEIYNLSDCYVFPTSDRSASIEIPLSVLEAMSCNIPVVSTKFGGLPEIFDQGDGLFFADHKNEFLEAIDAVRNKDVEVRTRDKVIPYSWERVGETLSAIYREIEAPS